jgi:uncharacterized secreted repeat protein (TIGR03808 family)
MTLTLLVTWYNTMDPQRRRLLTWSGAASAAAAMALPPRTEAAPISALGLDAAQMGVRPGSLDDQSKNLQRAIERAAAARVPLALAPGIYRVAALQLPSGAEIVGVRGATRLVFAGGPSLLMANHAADVTLRGLTLDGDGKALPPNQGIVHFEDTSGVRILDCAILAAGGHGVRLAAVAGTVSGSIIADAADVALLSSDGRGLTIAGNVITGAGNNGIVIMRGADGHDGTMVLDNRIDDIRNRNGGSGQFGNAINAFRSADVIIRGNVIRRCAFSGIRGNSASGIQITGNNVHDAGEVALYSEFGFEGAIVAGNIVDGAQTGVSIANFNVGGRLASVHGNIFRNLAPRTPNPAQGELLGIGIYVEADTAVNANVVESAQAAGIVIGWGPYLRDVAVTGNVVRKSAIGIGASVVPGAGSALISSNVLSGLSRGAVVGMDHARPVTGDLARDGAKLYAHLSISGNRIG